MNLADDYQEIQTIADAICDENATPEQVQRLEQLLTGDRQAQQFYADYIDMHMQLLSPADDSVEYVYRRMEHTRAEEFIVRPNTAKADHNNTSQGQLEGFANNTVNSTANNTINNAASNSGTSSGNNLGTSSGNNSANNPANNTANNSANKLTLFTVIALLIAVFSWPFIQRPPMQFSAEIVYGRFAIVELGHIDGNALSAGEYLAEQASLLELSSGDLLSLSAHSVIKLFNNNEIALKRGAITISSLPHNNIIVHAPNSRLFTNGSSLTVDLTSPSPMVISGETTLLSPKRWRPKHYWSFDSQSDRAIDSAGDAHGFADTGAVRSQGLLGQGAYHFNNTAQARINVGSGGGTAPATGSFAVTDGVTIEALIQPDYSAKLGDVDEIFRKDQTDEDLRMLLSFQNDHGKNYLKPEGDFNESLSFGLYLVGPGYHELKLPLDGQHGRPSLADLKDGNSHHVVATYNVNTGLKAIYLDGAMLAFYQYPAGSKMLSGGSGMANIGNSPSHPNNEMMYYNEAFSGVIDEVAFYDFALTPFMVQQHYNNSQQASNYFGLPPSSQVLPEQLKISLPKNSTIKLSGLTGLPYQVDKAQK